MSTRILSFLNFKGGVGKTANVVNVAACLAKYHEKRVLVVDLDPQANSSLWLMKPEAYREHVKDLKRSVYQIFIDCMEVKQRFDFDKAVVRGVPRAEFPLIANLDLLPSVVQLMKVESLINKKRYWKYYGFLQKTLEERFQEYDYVFLDCPPNVYSVTKNALFSATHLIVPYVPDFLSLSGFEAFADLVEDFYNECKSHVGNRKRAEITGFIINQYQKGRTVFADGINNLEMAINQMVPTGKIHKQARVLAPYIRHCSRVAASTDAHLPVVLFDHNSIGAEDYSELTQNLLNFIEQEVK